MNSRPVIGRTLALAVVLTLLSMCVVEVVHSAMPHRAPMDCAALLCNGPTGCAPTTTVAFQGLPVATVPDIPTLDAPSAPVWVAFVAYPSPPSKRHLLPSGPRSPPLA